MLLCLDDENQQPVSSELKKNLIWNHNIQIDDGNEKLYTMLSQVKASQNSEQMIGNT